MLTVSAARRALPGGGHRHGDVLVVLTGKECVDESAQHVDARETAAMEFGIASSEGSRSYGNARLEWTESSRLLAGVGFRGDVIARAV